MIAPQMTLLVSTCGRDWREVMRQEPVDVVFGSAATPAQCEWLRTTLVPLRIIKFAEPKERLSRSVLHSPPELVAVELTISTDMLASSARTLKVRRHQYCPWMVLQRGQRIQRYRSVRANATAGPGFEG